MRYLLFLLLLPFATIARQKKVYPNPCDSLTKVVQVDRGISASALADHIATVIKSFQLHKEDVLTFERANDSTIVGSGIFFVEKETRYRMDSVYGEYIIPANSDGKISFKFVINTKPDRYRYEFYELHHFNCRNTYDNFCDKFYTSGYKIALGLKLRMLGRVNSLNNLILKSFTGSDW